MLREANAFLRVVAVNKDQAKKDNEESAFSDRMQIHWKHEITPKTEYDVKEKGMFK
jgi:hypothetical protein